MLSGGGFVLMDLRGYLGGNTFRLPWVWGCFCFFLAASTALALAPIPPLTSPVMDSTGTLSAEDTQHLVEQALQLQSEQGSQLQVLVVSTTKPEDIAQYSQRVFDQWKLGREGVDDGVLLVVAKDDRRVRIHVGYGLEGVLPDIVANRIMNNYIIPHFKDGDYSAGIVAGFAALEKAMRGAELPPLPAAKPLPIIVLIFIGIFLFVGFCGFPCLFLLLVYFLVKARGSSGGGGFGGTSGGTDGGGSSWYSDSGGSSWSGDGGSSGGGGSSGSW